jgi:hypothetical protein
MTGTRCNSEDSAREMGIRLSQRFDRELTFVLLYVFTTLMFRHASDEDSTRAVDALAKAGLSRLAHLEGVHSELSYKSIEHALIVSEKSNCA